MKILADENIYEPIIGYLRNSGHDVISIRDSGLSGMSDDDVYKRACAEKRVIITMDKDFSRTFRFPPEECGGIIIVKLYKVTVEEACKLFKNCFAALKKDDITENLIVVTQEGTRIRRSRR